MPVERYGIKFAREDGSKTIFYVERYGSDYCVEQCTIDKNLSVRVHNQIWIPASLWEAFCTFIADVHAGSREAIPGTQLWLALENPDQPVP